MKIFRNLIFIFSICKINSLAFYVGPRFGLDLSTISLKGKLNDQVNEIKNVITSTKNNGKWANRMNFGLSVEGFSSLNMFSLGLCLDLGKSFRKNNKISTSIKNTEYTIKANSWTFGLSGIAGFNLSLFRLLLFAGPHGQYMEYSNDKTNQKHREWQWTPMLGIGTQIRLVVMVLELRYLQPVQFNLFNQGSETTNKRIVFNKKGAGTLSISALMRV